TVAAHASTSFAFAAIPPILTQAFPSRIRYTGVSMAYQFGSILGGGFAPMIATTLFAATGQTWPIGLYVVTASVLMLLSIAGLGLYYRAQNAARRDAASDARQEMVSAQLSHSFKTPVLWKVHSLAGGEHSGGEVQEWGSV